MPAWLMPGHVGTRRCQSKMAIERDLRQSGRTASVDQTEARDVAASSILRVARYFMYQGEKPTNRSQ